MKVKHITQHNNYTSGFRLKALPEQNKSNHMPRANENELRLGKNTAEIRPATSVNFGGSIDLKDAEALTRKAIVNMTKSGNKAYEDLVSSGDGEKIVKKYSSKVLSFINSKRWNEALRVVKDNEALFENLITIVLAGLLKPICVLAMPGAEEKDKQTTATKNFVAAVTGFAMSTLILTPISVGVRKVSANLPKYVKDPEYIKQINPKDGPLSDAFTTFYKKVADLAITPTKAAITIAFMPVLLNFLFKNKNEKADKQKEANVKVETAKAEIKPEAQKIEKTEETKKENPMEKYLVKGATK